MMPDEEQIQRAVLDHVVAEWPRRQSESFVWELGPLQQAMPHFRVIRIPPPDGNRGYWRYLSVGSWFGTRDEGHGHEFILHSSHEEALHTELLAQLTYYNGDPDHRLRVGDTIPIGRPWIGDSAADHVILVPAHAYSEEFEYLTVADFLVHFLWVVPITEAEVRFRHAHGFDAFEERLETSGVDVADPHRPSIV